MNIASVLTGRRAPASWPEGLKCAGVALTASGVLYVLVALVFTSSWEFAGLAKRCIVASTLRWSVFAVVYLVALIVAGTSIGALRGDTRTRMSEPGVFMISASSAFLALTLLWARAVTHVFGYGVVQAYVGMLIPWAPTVLLVTRISRRHFGLSRRSAMLAAASCLVPIVVVFPYLYLWIAFRVDVFLAEYVMSY